MKLYIKRAITVFVLTGSLFWVCPHAQTFAGSHHRKKVCYQLQPMVKHDAENEASVVPNANIYQLCMESHDLRLYPKSIVTFTFRKVSTDKASAASGTGAEPRPNELPDYARRHFSLLSAGKFGHRAHPDKPMVEFAPSSDSVFLGFVTQHGANFSAAREEEGAPAQPIQPALSEAN